MRRCLAALAGVATVATVAACATGGQQGAASSEVRELAQLLAAIDARALDAADADRFLTRGSAQLRRIATLGIGQSGARALAPRLRELVADTDTAVAANAAFALGLLADTAGVPRLALALGSAPVVAREAAWALGEIGGPATEAVVAALGVRAASREPSEVTAALLLAAAKLRPVPASTIVPFTAVGDPAVRTAATYALSRSRVPGGVRVLLSLAADSAPEIRSHVARGLARPAAGDSLADTAFAILARLARDLHPHARISAARSLATYGARAAAVVPRLAADGDANVRVAAAEAAGAVLGPGSPAWSSTWDADTSFAVRRALLAGAAPHGALRAEAERWARAGDWRRRAAAASVLRADAPRGRAAAIGDADGRVRAAAYDALAARLDSADAPPSLRPTLLAALADSDPFVRAGATTALAARPRPGEARTVLDSYARAAADADSDARLAALRYLAALWRADSAGLAPDDAGAVRALAVRDDPLERSAAAGLPVSGGAATTAAPHPESWYERVARTTLLPGLAGRPPRATISTVRGDVLLELFAADAPLTVANFTSLVERGYYRGTRFHRVVPGFVAQDGDPRGDGNGGPGHAIRDEHNRRRYDRGALGMALSGPNTGGSQYFITLAPQPHLDGHYTVFGRVLGGHSVLDRIVQGDSILAVRIER